MRTKKDQIMQLKINLVLLHEICSFDYQENQ